MDLLDLWRGDITPRRLLAYIDYLPSWSAFIEASAQDDEVAEMYADRGEAVAQPPRLTEWTPERAELVKVVEAVQSLTSLVSTALGGSAQPPQPQPRPVTAADRLAERVGDAAYEYIMERVEEARRREEA